MKKVLITGAAGFIGSHLTEYFSKKNFRLTVFDRYNSFGSFGWLDTIKKDKNIKFKLGDIRDFDSVNNVIKGQDIVIHLAALIGIPYSYESPSAYIKTNIEGTYNVLESARMNNLEQILITSTSETYGTAKSYKINEKHVINAQSPYAATKSAADQLALSYYKSFNTPIKIVKPFNTNGPRQSLRAVLPTIICQALENNEIKIGNLNTSRDLTYIEDTCKGFLSILNSKKTFGEIVNIGSDNNYTVLDLIKKVSKILNKKLITKKNKERVRPSKSEVYRLRCDNTKIQKLTNWKPRFHSGRGFEKGLENTIKWFSDKDNLNFYKKEMFKTYNV